MEKLLSDLIGGKDGKTLAEKIGIDPILKQYSDKCWTSGNIVKFLFYYVEESWFLEIDTPLATCTYLPDGEYTVEQEKKTWK